MCETECWIWSEIMDIYGHSAPYFTLKVSKEVLNANMKDIKIIYSW